MPSKLNILLSAFVLIGVVVLAVQVSVLDLAGDRARAEFDERLSHINSQLSQLDSRQAAAEQASVWRDSEIISRLDKSLANPATTEELAIERTKSQVLAHFLRDMLASARSNPVKAQDALWQEALALAAEIQTTDPETAATIRAAMKHAAAPVTSSSDEVASEAATQPNQPDSLHRSPWPKLQWIKGVPCASWDGPWYEIQKINGVAIDDILAVCEDFYPGRVQEAFAIHFVELLELAVGEPIEATVSLRLRERETGTITVIPNRELAEANYAKLMEFLNLSPDEF